jgi:hypothetical protein
MRKFALIAAAIGIMVLTVAFYPGYVQKPEKDGPGPLSVYVDPVYSAPEYHSPLYWWQSHHPDMVNRGDLLQEDCLHCHDPATSCNNCHGYVGANPIVE